LKNSRVEISVLLLQTITIAETIIQVSKVTRNETFLYSASFLSILFGYS
jgi:hypothetical protein